MRVVHLFVPRRRCWFLTLDCHLHYFVSTEFPQKKEISAEFNAINYFTARNIGVEGSQEVDSTIGTHSSFSAERERVREERVKPNTTTSSFN